MAVERSVGSNNKPGVGTGWCTTHNSCWQAKELALGNSLQGTECSSINTSENNILLTTHANKLGSWHWETVHQAQGAPVSMHQKTIYSCSKNLSLFTSSLFISSQARLSQGKSSPSSSSLSKEAIRASMWCLASLAMEMWPLRYALLRSCKLSNISLLRRFWYLVPVRPPLENMRSDSVAYPWIAR